MKILHEGTPPGYKIGRFTCGYCKSIVEATVGESYEQDYTYQGNYLYFKCPVCGGNVGIAMRTFLGAARNG
jgi:hypothetical protein